MKPLVRFLLLLLILTSCRTSYEIDAVVAYPRPGEEVHAGDAVIDAMISPYREELKLTMDREIGHLNVDLVKELPESNMGNWLADMMLEEARNLTDVPVDFAVQNYGGMRINQLTAGPITIGEMFEIMPFDNLIFILEGDGQLVQKLMDHLAASGGWPVSAGVRFVISDERATQLYIHDQALDSSRIYRFAVPDYVANGGSGSFFLRDCERIETAVYVRDAFINHITKDDKKGIQQEAFKEGRIKIAENG